MGNERTTGFLNTGFLDAGFLSIPIGAEEAEEPEPTPEVDVTGRWGYRIIFYDSDWDKVGEYSSDMGSPPVISLKFEVVQTGSGAFTLELVEMPTFSFTYLCHIKVFLWGQPESEPIYAGRVLKIPDERTTKDTFKYSGHGLYHDLEFCGVNRSYQDMEVSAIVKDILVNDIQPYTSIGYSGPKIVQTSPSYKVSEINFDRVSAKDALKDLAEYAYNVDNELPYEFGVDADGDLFFRPISVAVVVDAVKWVGYHVESFEPKEDIEPVRNKIDIICGAIDEVESSNYADTVSDGTSQGLYGVRWTKKTIPSALTAADALRWGRYQLYLLKDPKQSAKAKNIDLQNEGLIIARGKARVFDGEGVELELPIKKAAYTVSADKAIRCDLDLGDLELQPLDAQYIDMLRRLKKEEALQAANVGQLA